jgi:A/G-specific adenine glycosylase
VGLARIKALPKEFLWESLLVWYRTEGRKLPWRETTDPYAIWVSEMMLQQTQVKTVLPYYRRWLTRFPTLSDLAQADLESVLKVWEGLGYYARARHLHRAAQILEQDYGGVFPQTLEAALKLPGIGRSTAGGILSSAFNLPVPILDGNVKRVFARLMALPVPPQKALSQLWDLSETLLAPQAPKDWNQALMDLGSLVCIRRRPLCGDCPWSALCLAYAQGLQHQLPKTMTKAPLPHKRIGVAVIVKENQRFLVDRRPPQGLLGGLWEFPGGKIEAGETVPDCIVREIREELALEIEVGEELIVLDHAYTHFRVTLYVHLCGYLGGEPQALACEEVRWVSLEELATLPFPAANQKIIDALRRRFSQETGTAPGLSG